MKYLLDTDALSELCRNSPMASLVRRVGGVPPADQLTSSITVGELMYGAHRNEVHRDLLLLRIERVIRSHIVVVAFDEESARYYGALRATLERAGTPIGDADTRIAAIALTHDLTVVTGNVRHFDQVPGLRIENWFE